MATLALPLNLEMAATPEMQAIALRHRPHAACIVPERREERTTEGGLEVANDESRLADFIGPLRDAGIRVSIFIAADRRQIEAAHRIGAPVIELHTGAWCEAGLAGDAAAEAHELARLTEMAAFAHGLGLEVHAGHGLTYDNVRPIAALPRGARAQHRPLPGRRGDLRRPRGRDRPDAGRDGRRPRPGVMGANRRVFKG